MVPTLALGIPGSATTAVILTGLIIHGVRPGPDLFREQPDFLYGIFGAMLIANILFFIFGTLNPMMHFRSQTMHSRFIHKYIDVANNRNDMFIEWMKTSTTDWSVSRLPLSNNTTSSPILNYEQCVCLED